MDVGVFEARNRFSELIDAAERGEEVTVLRYGKPVAKLVPITAPEDVAARRRRAIEESVALGEKIRQRLGRVLAHDEIVAAKDEGRP
ncbi:MAG: type toxin-antitoxin system prevent-host-death family antitoxin [Caulobacter sp.]|nr:type toxin-antitoxin system prevent-host-death family antitoxin [Caulobacter sp.]